MRRMLAFVVVALFATFVIAVSPASGAKSKSKPRSTVIGGIKPGPGARTIPFFSGTYTFSSKTYGYTMVGTAPSTGATTTVPTEIQPIRVVFADGTVFDATSNVSSVLASPIFTRAHFTSGFTQYGDAIQRAEFWNAGGSGSYHVLLGQPTILPTLTLRVPNGAGFVSTADTGATIGVINISWWSGRINEALNTEGFSPTTLPIFLSRDIVLYISQPQICCVFGYHGANGAGNGNGNQPIQTYLWSSYISSPIFADAPSIVNVNGLSHEVSEWYNDPFGINKAPTWYSPLAPQYGCSAYLETGDPLVGVSFTVNGYSLQDEAFKSWFAHDTPSTGINGQYTYLGTFASPSPLC